MWVMRSGALFGILFCLATARAAEAKDCMEASDAPLPDVVIQAVDEAPADLAPWLGHFQGAWYSQGEMALCHRLVVSAIVPEEGSDGHILKVKYSYGAYDRWNIREPRILDREGRINDQGELELSWRSSRGWKRIVRYRIVSPDKLSGTYATGQGEEVHSGWTIVHTTPTDLVRKSLGSN